MTISSPPVILSSGLNPTLQNVQEAATLMGMPMKEFCSRMRIVPPPDIDSVSAGRQDFDDIQRQNELETISATQADIISRSFLEHSDPDDVESWLGLDGPGPLDYDLLGSLDDFAQLTTPHDGPHHVLPEDSSLVAERPEPGSITQDQLNLPTANIVGASPGINSSPTGHSEQDSLSNQGTSGEDSSNFIPTPDTESSIDLSVSSSHDATDERAITPEEEQLTLNALMLGPCSKVWVVPRRTRRRRQPRGVNQESKRTADDGAVTKRARRGPFKDEKFRHETAQTRLTKSCIRCRMQQIRCFQDPLDPHGVCLTCKNVKRPITCTLPCLRWIITDSSLYREQDMPYQLFSRRWKSMDLVDIDTWASDDVKTVYISQTYLDAPHVAKVREFIPIDGDMVEEQWMTGSEVKTHPVPRYALANMKESATIIENFIDASVGRYILGTIGGLNDLLWQTYFFAFSYQRQAKTKVEQELLLNCFRLWVACRKTSHPERIYGEDKLGGAAVDDPESPFFNLVPAPILITVQLECILYSRVLRPKAEQVLRKLNELVRKNKREYWMTIYLTMFILLHSCSMITRRDWETARQYNLHKEFANPESIRKHHSGCQTMLAHFHYINKGVLPFYMTDDDKSLRELKQIADLNDGEVEFVQLTSRLVNDNQRDFEMVREKRLFDHDLFWVSQLYDPKWKPGPTA